MIVTMPDGTNVNFPDDMPREQIKGLIASKFPDVTKQASSGDAMAQWKQEQSQFTSGESAKKALGDIGQIAARTGRVGMGIAGSALDLPAVVGQSAYDTTRSVQEAIGARQAPAYKVPLPSEGLKSLYDVATGGAGNVGGDAGAMD